MESILESQRLALVIEDDEDLSIIFAEALNLAGFETKTIRDGRQALQEIGACLPNLILLDLHLPHVNGLQILDAIRKDERLRKTKVVIATADARMSEIAVDADFTLIKPISFAQLRDLSRRLR